MRTNVETIQLLEDQIKKLEREKIDLPWFTYPQVMKQKEIMELKVAIRNLKEKNYGASRN